MTAALNGAGVDFATILIAGLAFAVAGAISMFFSSYLSRRSELDSLKVDMEREKMEIETEPEEERAELEKLLADEGYSRAEVAVIMGRLVKNKEMWLREQLRRELRLNTEDLASDRLRRPAAAGIAFILLALVTLTPYALVTARLEALGVSVAVSLVALFALSSRAFIPRHFRLRVGLESVLVGGLAAALLFLAGLLLGKA
jgi:vacuolar iron transporter family protein